MSMLKPATLEDKPKPDKPKKEKKVKSESKPEETVEVKENKKENGTKYKFPFGMFFNHQEHDISHVFRDGEEYSTTEISNEMLRHGFYDFSGYASYDYIKDDNMLVVSFKKHAHG